MSYFNPFMTTASVMKEFNLSRQSDHYFKMDRKKRVLINLFSLQRRVKAFRRQMFEIVVHTNNSVERKNRDFKYEYLSQYKDNSVSGMATALAEQHLPDIYDR